MREDFFSKLEDELSVTISNDFFSNSMQIQLQGWKIISIISAELDFNKWFMDTKR